MPQYELMFIAQPQLEEEPLNALVERVSRTITDLQGEVTQTDPWGKRRLAYPVKGFADGFYYLLQMQLPASAVREVENRLKLMEDVIRFLVIRKGE